MQELRYVWIAGTLRGFDLTPLQKATWQAGGCLLFSQDFHMLSPITLTSPVQFQFQ
jgi:hypothetical protein